MEKPSQEVLVKNVSKGPLTLAAPGYQKIFVDLGKSHSFANMKIWEVYKRSAQALKALGMVEIVMGGKVDKQEPTPKIFEQEKKMEEAAKASKMEPVAPAPVAEAVEEEVEEKEEKPVAKPANKKK